MRPAFTKEPSETFNSVFPLGHETRAARHKHVEPLNVLRQCGFVEVQSLLEEVGLDSCAHVKAGSSGKRLAAESLRLAMAC